MNGYEPLTAKFANFLTHHNVIGASWVQLACLFLILAALSIIHYFPADECSQDIDYGHTETAALKHTTTTAKKANTTTYRAWYRENIPFVKIVVS